MPISSVEAAPTLRKGERTRLRILDVAAEQLAAKGYAGTTLTEIAAAAGMQPGSVYYHFDSKDEVVEAVLAEGLSHADVALAGAISTAAGVRAATNLRNVAVAYVGSLIADSHYAVANIRCYAEAPPKTRVRLQVPMRAFVSQWVALIEAGQRDGSIRTDVHAPAQARMVIGALNSVALWFRAGGEVEIARLAEELADTLVAGLVPDYAGFPRTPGTP